MPATSRKFSVLVGGYAQRKNYDYVITVPCLIVRPLEKKPTNTILPQKCDEMKHFKIQVTASTVILVQHVLTLVFNGYILFS